MVEKVFISPNRVRAYGNIVNMKTGDDFTLVNSELTVTTDTVDGAEMTVFQFEVEGGISIALTSSSSTCNVGDNVLLTATVIDGNAPVEAAGVTFKVGETVLGTDETDANGVATYTYAASTAGTFSFTASYQDSTSPVVSVSVNHSYSLSFSQSSYVATGGSATLSVTLLEDNVALSGASVTVTGSDGSVYNGITNSNGVATFNLTGLTSSGTYTCSYSNVSDSCTVTVVNYLFYDGGVTGNVNTDYTNVGSGIQIDVTSTGTKISCTSYANRYRRPNVLLSGDFRVTVTCVQTTDNGFEMALLNSSNTQQYHLTFSWANGKDWNNNDTQIVTNLSAVTDSPVVMERVGSTLTVKCNGTQLLTRSITTADVYYAFGTHRQGNRYCIIKDLMIEAL